MTVAQAIAGYTLAEADVLCYAIRKKVKDKLLAQREKFAAGARARGVPARVVDQIFDQFEPFARYGFNRAHAACYGLIAYYTAYLKAHYPAEYMTAVLSSEAGNADKVAQVVAECRRMGIRILPPDVNSSAASFTVDGGAIRFGLAAVRNVGVGAIEAIIAAREAGGPFRSLADLCSRVDTRQVNQRVIASLIKAGALDSLGTSRAEMLRTLDETVEQAQRAQRAQLRGQTGLFNLEVDPRPARPSSNGEPVQEFSREELLAMEKEMLGLYISDHPLRRWEPVLARRVTATVAQLPELADRHEVVVGGLVTAVKRSLTRAGSAMAFVTLEDLTGTVEVVVFPRAYEQHAEALKRDAVVLLRGRVDVEEQSTKVLCEEVIPLPPSPEEADGDGGGERSAMSFSGSAGGAGADNGRPAIRVRVSTLEEIDQLDRFLREHPGTRRVCAHVVTDEGEHVVPAQGRLDDHEGVLGELERLFGEGNVWEE